MRNVLAWIITILLVIGTTGLLLNEFLLDWGRTTTITFAFFNLIGIALLILSRWLNQNAGIDNRSD